VSSAACVTIESAIEDSISITHTIGTITTAMFYLSVSEYRCVLCILLSLYTTLPIYYSMLRYNKENTPTGEVLHNKNARRRTG
jgi:hypothetical protein